MSWSKNQECQTLDLLYLEHSLNTMYLLKGLGIEQITGFEWSQNLPADL